ncbi:MAG: hypothetical protein LBH79_05905 [Nitrososphaerota archaeon]|jgi:hypothetical protein|nr:hypothetical protein [Nitrososphaerota archaeon]
MKDSLKKLFSKRALTLVFVALLVLSILNTYLILDGTSSSMRTTVVNYDFVLSQEGSTLNLKNMHTGYVVQPRSTQEALNRALSDGNSVYINQGSYTLGGDVKVIDKLNARIISDGATLECNGYKIIIYGANYTVSQYALISGLTLIGGTIHVENSFATTITNTKLINTTTGIEFLNSNTWSEYNKIEGCQFINNTESIVFRTPRNTQTDNIFGSVSGSYGSSVIERCYFNLKDHEVGIKVEPYAEFSESRMQNIRFWMGENGQHLNQTALKLEGSMAQTLFIGVVFESFADKPLDMFAIDVGKYCDALPDFRDGVSFLGSWTERIHNPFNIKLRAGIEATVKQEAVIPVGTSGEYGETQTLKWFSLTSSSFKPKIDVTGTLQPNEIITVRVRIEYVDNSVSTSAIRSFSASGSALLSDNDMMQLFSSQSVIWAILVDAKTNTATTNAKVTISN